MTIAFDDGPVPEIEIRHRLRIAREWAGLDQEQLAARMEVARNTVSNYESGHTTNMRRIVLRSWARVCGVSHQWLTGDNPTGGDALPKPGGDQPTDYESDGWWTNRDHAA